MVIIACKEQSYSYNAYHIVKAFYPEETIEQRIDAKQEPLVLVVPDGGSCFSIFSDELKQEENPKKAVTKALYEHLCKITSKTMSWGMLTGVRPTKLAMGKLKEGLSDEEAAWFMQNEYGVSSKKARLACEIARREDTILKPLDYENGFSLYAGIPFCPSICSYCSFGSAPLSVFQELTDPYVEALCREIRFLGETSRGRKLNTIYIGGGTPTSLSAKQLQRLLDTIAESFSMEHLLEYTVEAGRPDSITKEKLQVIQNAGATRISVNPQTMQQKTLDLVGRRHTVQDVIDIFHLARELGFDNINMDLIAGLPGEDASDMEDTLRKIESLQPDSLTIHALAIKRAARMGIEEKTNQKHYSGMLSAEEITRMVELGMEYAGRMDLIPYYLYRQKNIAGNFENVGYAKVDKAGIYNILIMEEKQTILSAGAGSTTKCVLKEKIRTENGKESNLIRIENVKNVREYIGRVDEMIEKKERSIRWH